MADDDDKQPEETDSEASDVEVVAAPRAAASAPQDEAPVDAGPAQLGATKYVHAAFLAAGVLVAYFSGKVLGAAWNHLADWPAAAERLPFLLRYSEDERPTFTMTAGLLIGVILVWRTYRTSEIQRWADDVATELSKVHWPDKDLVTKGTVVVLVASAFATIYIGLLDRLWSFVTALVYGA